MESIYLYFEKNKSTFLVSVAVILVVAGVLFFGSNGLGTGVEQHIGGLQNMPQRNYPCIQAPVTGQVVVQNSVKLDIGVTLAGKGSVIAVDPGSPAEMAGLQVGDIINQTNGR